MESVALARSSQTSAAKLLIGLRATQRLRKKPGRLAGLRVLHFNSKRR